MLCIFCSNDYWIYSSFDRIEFSSFVRQKLIERINQTLGSKFTSLSIQSSNIREMMPPFTCFSNNFHKIFRSLIFNWRKPWPNRKKNVRPNVLHWRQKKNSGKEFHFSIMNKKKEKKID